MANHTAEPHTAPYGPWITFENWLRGFKDKPGPSRIETNLFPGMSGSGQSQLRGALRFFGIVTGDRDDVVPEKFAQLVEAVGTDRWQEVLAELVPRSYAHIVNGIDLDNGTEGQLREAFDRHGGVTGSSNKKARRFYLAAMEAAGLPVSPFFAPDTRTKGSNGAAGGPKRKKRANRKVNEPPPAEDPIPDGMREISFDLPNKRRIKLVLPVELSPDEEGFLITYIRQYLKLERGRRNDQED